MTNPPLVHTIPEVCDAARACRTVVYDAINSGELRAIKRGKRTLVRHDDLCRWIDGLPAVTVVGKIEETA